MLRLTLACFCALTITACSPDPVKTGPVENPAIESSIIRKEANKGTLHHEIDVTITPSTHSLVASDVLTIPTNLAKDGLKIMINSDLTIEKTAGSINLQLVAESRNADDLGMDRDNSSEDSIIKANIYELSNFAGSDNTITLSMVGEINNEIQQLGTEYARGFSSSPGLIEDRGAYLAGATYWVPTIEDTLITYNLSVTLPEGWSSVSQGARKQNLVFRIPRCA